MENVRQILYSIFSNEAIEFAAFTQKGNTPGYVFKNGEWEYYDKKFPLDKIENHGVDTYTQANRDRFFKEVNKLIVNKKSKDNLLYQGQNENEKFAVLHFYYTKTIM